MKVAAFVTLLALTTPGYATSIFDPSPQTWNVSGVFAIALAESADLFPELTLENYQGAEAIDLETSMCSLSVLRPGHLAAPMASDDNTLACLWVNMDGTPGALLFDLSATAFQAWGNRPSEAHWHRNDLPKPFQILLNEGFDRDINMRLFTAMYRRSQLGDVNFSTSHICGPDGILCSGWVSFDTDPGDRYSPSYLTCTINTEGTAIYQTRCVFMMP